MTLRPTSNCRHLATSGRKGSSAREWLSCFSLSQFSTVLCFYRSDVGAKPIYVMRLIYLSIYIYDPFHVSHDRDWSISVDRVEQSFPYQSPLSASKKDRVFDVLWRFYGELCWSWPSQIALLQLSLLTNGASWRGEILKGYRWVKNLAIANILGRQVQPFVPRWYL